MKTIRQAITVASYNFYHWKRNPRIIITFSLSFVMCFLLSDKAIDFAQDHNTSMQLYESFIWTFGDSNSILLSSLLIILLFADMPFLTSGTPLYLVRTSRKTWIYGQIIYTTLATLLYLLFVLFSTSVISIKQSFFANMWSPTAAILGYSGAGKTVALPALVKTLEMSLPYRCMITILFLMLGYTLVVVFIMLIFNLRYGYAAGVVSVFVFSVYGVLLNPQNIASIFKLPSGLFYKANVAVGWISPLNHATYHMHNFGYDLLPRLWQSFSIFLLLIVSGFYFSLKVIDNFNFNFLGTEG